MEYDLSIFSKEIEAGFITPNYEVYSNAPDYIQKMAKSVNAEYIKSYGFEFFKFIKEECLMESENLPPLPSDLIKLRKELEKKYQ